MFSKLHVLCMWLFLMGRWYNLSVIEYLWTGSMWGIMCWFRRGLCALPVALVIWSTATLLLSYAIAVVFGHADPIIPYIRWVLPSFHFGCTCNLCFSLLCWICVELHVKLNCRDDNVILGTFEMNITWFKFLFLSYCVLFVVTRALRFLNDVCSASCFQSRLSWVTFLRLLTF